MRRLLEGTMAVLLLQLASGCVVSFVSYSYTASLSAETPAQFIVDTEPAGVMATTSDGSICTTPCSLKVDPASDPVLTVEKKIGPETVRAVLRLRVQSERIRAASSDKVIFESKFPLSCDDNDCQQHPYPWCCACLSSDSTFDESPEQRSHVYSPLVVRLIEIGDEGNVREQAR